MNDRERYFNRVSSNRTRGKGFKLGEGRFMLDIRKIFCFFFLMVRLVKHWNRLPIKTVDALSLETFLVRLERTLSKQI